VESNTQALDERDVGGITQRFASWIGPNGELEADRRQQDCSLFDRQALG